MKLLGQRMEPRSENRGIFFRFFKIRLAIRICDVFLHPFVAEIFLFIRSFFFLLRCFVDWIHTFEAARLSPLIQPYTW
jgi:hypothetical protein